MFLLLHYDDSQLVMRRETKKKHRQLYLYLDFFKTDNESIHCKLDNLSQKKRHDKHESTVSQHAATMHTSPIHVPLQDLQCQEAHIPLKPLKLMHKGL